MGGTVRGTEPAECEISIVGGDSVKKRICGAAVALLWALSCFLTAGAENFGIYQGYVVGSALEDEEGPQAIQGHTVDNVGKDAEESEIIQGHILDGVTAENGASAPNPAQTAQSFTVTFAPNAPGASVSPTSKRVVNTRAYGKLPVPTREGYVFDGWQTKSGENVAANTVVNLNANQTLYAQWRVATVEVRFDANGGSLKVISMDIPIGGDYGELPQPVRGGYAFAGWYTQARGGRRVSNYDALTSTQDHTLYAHWAALAAAPTEPETYLTTVFEDVPTTSSYYPAVYWAVQRGLTSGTSAETFSPNEPCKRRHILTFLWRANGCPDPIGTLGGSGPSGTLNASDGIWAKGAVWAYENQLIPTALAYNEEENSTRSDAVTYLWKLAGCPVEEASVQSIVARFTDVSPESEYASAVAWALETGITNGTTETTFSPDRICTRGQIVTFLYRCYTR